MMANVNSLQRKEQDFTIFNMNLLASAQIFTTEKKIVVCLSNNPTPLVITGSDACYASILKQLEKFKEDLLKTSIGVI